MADFNDQLVGAICRIYNETPIRQGKAFWHYGKDYQSIRRALATYLDRSLFIVARHGGELIGFMKTTSVNGTATMTQILSAKRHFDKRPNNALIAKAVEICESQRMSHLIYGSFVYYDPDSSLTEFKRRSGFEPVPLPRYYVPLTVKGRIALKLGLHRGVAANVPKPLFRQFLKIRSLWYARRSKAPETVEARVWELCKIQDRRLLECLESSDSSQEFQESRQFGSFSGWRPPFFMSRSILREHGSTSRSESMSGGLHEKALFPMECP